MANVECNIEQSQNLSNSVPNIDLNDSISSIAPFENDPDLDIYQLIANPDKFDDNDSDNMLISPVSNYYSADKINYVFENFGSTIMAKTNETPWSIYYSIFFTPSPLTMLVR